MKRVQKIVTAEQFRYGNPLPDGVVEDRGYGFKLRDPTRGLTRPLWLTHLDWVLTDEFGGLSSCSDEDFKKLWKPVVECPQT